MRTTTEPASGGLCEDESSQPTQECEQSLARRYSLQSGLFMLPGEEGGIFREVKQLAQSNTGRAGIKTKTLCDY